MEIHTSRSSFTTFFFYNTRSAGFWLVVRLLVAYEWIYAGYEKVINPVWVGEKAGLAVTGFLQGALQKTTGLHPDVSQGYAWFIQHVALPHASTFSYLVSYGELLVGVALLFGFLVGVSAFFGLTMNFNYLFAGTVSINPYMVIAQVFLLLGWRVAGWYGLDRKVLALFRRR
jgi:thiosulfate dehydrogenase [quinone] large subunit